MSNALIILIILQMNFVIYVQMDVLNAIMKDM